MITDEELDSMLSRSIEVGKTVEMLEQEYNLLIHGLMDIHHSNVKSVGDMRDEIKIIGDCFDAIERRFG